MLKRRRRDSWFALLLLAGSALLMGLLAVRFTDEILPHDQFTTAHNRLSVGVGENRASSPFQSASKHAPRKGAASHFCHSRDLLKDGGKRATCLFHNVCIKKSAKQPPARIGNKAVPLSEKHEIEFYYPYEEGSKPEENTASFSLGVGLHSVDDRLYFEPIPVEVEEWQTQHPKTNFVSGTSVMYYEYNNENFGHMLTDIFLPMFAALESLGLHMGSLPHLNVFRYSIEDALAYSCDFFATWNKSPADQKRDIARHCERFEQIMMSMLPGRNKEKQQHIPVLSRKTLTEDPMCFESLVVGMPMYSDDCLDGTHGRKQDDWSTCLHGRQEQFWRFRTYILDKVLGISTIQTPKQHKIVVTNRGSGWMDRALPNLNELVSSLKENFPSIDIVTVEWHELSWKEQLKMISDTTLLITPPGAVSFISLFLPRWATQIRLHNFEPLLEWHIFNYVGYTKAEYVDCSLDGRKVPIGHVLELAQKALKRYETFAVHN